MVCGRPEEEEEDEEVDEEEDEEDEEEVSPGARKRRFLRCGPGWLRVDQSEGTELYPVA